MPRPSDMMKAMRKMRSLLFFLFGIALGAVTFWLPTVFAGRPWRASPSADGNGFALPALLLFGPWYLTAIPYLVVFALMYGALVGIYRLLKISFPVSLTDVAWILPGIYLSLTFLLHFVGMAIKGGNLTI